MPFTPSLFFPPKASIELEKPLDAIAFIVSISLTFLQWQNPAPANVFSSTSTPSNFINCGHFNTCITTLCQGLSLSPTPAVTPVTGWILQEADSKMEITVQGVYEGVPLGSRPVEGKEAGLGRGRN